DIMNMNINIRRIPNNIAFLTGFICSLLIFVPVHSYKVAEADCATSNPAGWTKASPVSVYIKVGAGGFELDEIVEIEKALTNWSYNNTTKNCSDVFFIPDYSNTNALYKVDSNTGQSSRFPDAMAVTDMDRTTTVLH